ncbi:MAG: hypothetical protein ABSG98_12595 [Anaerolineales bacterium]|jgi:hypothetical protein
MFAKLAQELEAANHPRWAANMHALASHAYADSQNEQPSLDQARAALKLFLQYQMLRRAPVFYGNITRKMVKRGLGHAAEVLKAEFGNQIGSMPVPAPPVSAQSARLPTNCPKCGAPIHSAEANWIDPNTVECDFCGSQIRPQ